MYSTHYIREYDLGSVCTFFRVAVEERGGDKVVVYDMDSGGHTLLGVRAGCPDAIQVVCCFQGPYKGVAAAAPQTLQPKAPSHYLMVYLSIK